MAETKKEKEAEAATGIPADFIEKMSPEMLEALAEKISALKAKAEPEPAEQTEEDVFMKQIAAENARMEELVPITLFKDNDKYKDDLHIGVNGVMYTIQRGKPVMVPRKVANVIEAQMEQDMATANLISRESGEFAAEARRLEV